MLDTTGPGVTVGPSILGLVTSGIYDDPLAIYREYIQNAVDELSRQKGVEGKVEITIDPRQKRVSICDNGPGLTYQECLEDLVPLARSKKCFGQDRGFRGIGRLSGLAFADSVTFLTRSSGRDPVTRVVWSGAGITGRTNSTPTPEEGVHWRVSVGTPEDHDYPEHFFRVEIEGVSRHAAGSLLNRETVRGYIGEVCPVPLAPDFPFCKNIHEIFPPLQLPYSLRITLDAEQLPIRRQYGSAIPFAGNKEDYFNEFQVVRVPSIDGDEDAAVGWIAHSSYLGAIPKLNRIRGIRARVGNIQIGGERIFDHLFEEERFNRWCVGELHILDPRIVPNGRRDYFEQDPHLRNLENHLAPIFGQITARCRSASSNRNKEKKLMSVVADLEAIYELVAAGYLGADDTKALVQDTIHRISAIRERTCTGTSGGKLIAEMDKVELRLKSLQVEDAQFPNECVPSSEVLTYQRVFGAIVAVMPSAQAAKQAIEMFITKI